MATEAEVLEAPAIPETEPKTPPETKESEKKILKRSRKPPDDGLCRRCKQRRKLNRHKLCYPCFVESEIIDREKLEGKEWIPGDPHPSWCCCEGLGEHQERDGTSRWFN